MPANDRTVLDQLVALFNAGRINADQLRAAVDVVVARAR